MTEPAPKVVWILESGDYEQRCVEGVYVSAEAGIEAIKTRYGPEYKVAWDEPSHYGNAVVLAGTFPKIIGLSVGCRQGFKLTPWTVEGQ